MGRKCLCKPWIKILTTDNCERDKKRWEAEENQSISEMKYTEGNVEFTPEGALLYGRIETRIDVAKGRVR